MDNKKLSKIEKRLDEMAQSLDKSRFYEYIEYVTDRKRLFRRSFFMGLFRGTGTAIGFSICAAIIVIFLRSLAQSSVPYIADFISKIIDLIETGS